MSHLVPDPTSNPEGLAQRALSTLRLTTEQLKAASKVFTGCGSLDDAFSSGVCTREVLVGDLSLPRIDEARDTVRSVKLHLSLFWADAALFVLEMYGHEAA